MDLVLEVTVESLLQICLRLCRAVEGLPWDVDGYNNRSSHLGLWGKVRSKLSGRMFVGNEKRHLLSVRTVQSIDSGVEMRWYTRKSVAERKL